MNILFCTFSKLIFFISICLTILSCSQAQKLNEEQEEYISKTVEFYNNRNYDSAIYYSDKVLDFNPKNDIAWRIKGVGLYFLGKEEEAEKALSNAININPNNAESHKYRATIYHLNGEHRKAISDYDFYLKNEPNDELALAGKAKSYLRLKEYRKAIETYDYLLSLKIPPFSKVLNLSGRALVYMELKQYEKAQESIEEALEIGVESYIPLSTQSEILLQKGDYQQSLIVAKEALKLTKLYQDEELRKELAVYSKGHIGYVKHKLGNTEEGLGEVLASLEEMPTNSYVYKHLALISFDLGKKEEGCQYIEKGLELGFTKMFGTEMEELKQEKCTN
ncbi:tetratricopeptide repeat protein [Bernardetia sp. ABR2-2B]|uniref:tetratricopeptide repeat protein n=1 Tax=Bernardetia sp. ABR2-2B TaxID=3127472 RepID=UPI0030CC162E